MDPLVSILIPAYNAEKWISETIQSALDQTYSNKEIIIVNDGSTDNTLQIISSFEGKLVKIINQENRGAPVARNVALNSAQGDFIQWLDNDDLLDPQKISVQINRALENRDPHILYSGSCGHFYYCYQRAKFYRNSLCQDISPIEYFLIKFNENIWFQPGVWLVSRKLTDLAGPYFELRSPDDDGEYFCRVVANCEKIEYLPKARAYWRIGNFRSLSQTRTDDALEALSISIEKSINQLLKVENSDRTRRASINYLNKRLWHFYPNKVESIERASELATRLGGKLILPPDEGPKFNLISKLFGWEKAAFIRNFKHKLITFSLRSTDKLFYLFKYRRITKYADQ